LFKLLHNEQGCNFCLTV